jgi:catechol 2,3-dioxygenase-like lactoylglutathione lyase family enzyme
MEPTSLDHVAFWVAERESIVAFCERHLGMHVIDRQENFTLIGTNARRGKLTLFAAAGPRERGALEHVGLRVSDLAAARAELPDGTPDVFDIGEGVRLTLVAGETDVEYDLDHVALRTGDPSATARAYEDYGFAAATLPPAGRSPAGAARVEVGGAYVELHPAAGSHHVGAGAGERPLLNHLAVLVDSVEQILADAAERGIEVEQVVDAANTYAAFLRGPDGVRIEYVEHKPTFALT